MPSIGTIPVTMYRGETDSMEYALTGNSVSNTDLIAFRRTLPTAKPGGLIPEFYEVMCVANAPSQ